MSEPSVTKSSSPAQTFEDFYVPCIFRPWAEDLLRFASPKAGDRILDVACGTGIVARVVAQQQNGDVSLTGVDYSPVMLDVARLVSSREDLKIEWVEGNAESLPFPAAAFDLVIVQQGLQFFGDKVKALGEMHRVLTETGRIVSSTWTGIENQPFNKIFATEIRRQLGISAPSTAFSLGDRHALESLFKKSGFESVDVTVVKRDVYYPSPDQFVDLGVASATVAVPELGNIDEAALLYLAESVRDGMAAAIRQYTVDGQIVAPMEAHIVVASKRVGEAA